jgi:Plasmid pRiA4b ORF-3-like protein
VTGFEHFLEAWRDRKHADHRQVRTWAGRGYDPERFDLKRVNSDLKALREPAPMRRR